MTRKLDRKEKKAIRLKINNLLDDKCRNCPITTVDKDHSARISQCLPCPTYSELQKLGKLLEPKMVTTKEREEMVALNGLTVKKFEELRANGQSFSDIEREFNIKPATLRYHMKQQFNYEISKLREKANKKGKQKSQPKQSKQETEGLTIEVVQPFEPTVSLSEFQEAKVKLNESLFEINSLREEKKELEDRVKQLELYNKIEMNKAAVKRDYANTLKTQLEEASKVIEKKQYEILELQEDNMELSACLKRRLV